MAFTPAKETYPGKVYPVTVGTGDSAVTFGGENVLPFHSFEGATPNRPVIALEIQDVPPSDWPENVKRPLRVSRMIRLNGRNIARMSLRQRPSP